jgi:hypothetical protein
MDAQRKPSPTEPSPPAEGSSQGSSTATGGDEQFHHWAREPDPAAPDPAAPDPAERPATSAVRSIPIFVSEIKAYGRHFIGARFDGFIATGKRIAIYAVLGVVGLLAAAGVLFTAAFLLLSGLALGLGHLLWHQMWLGNVVVGLLVLGGTALGVKIGIGKFTRASRLKTEQKYEGQRIQQRVGFGRDAHERAEEARRRGRAR